LWDSKFQVLIVSSCFQSELAIRKIFLGFTQREFLSSTTLLTEADVVDGQKLEILLHRNV
jgi:hypothetical protein